MTTKARKREWPLLAALRRYHQSTRAVGPSLVLVMPLLVLYELAVALLDPPLRNSADLVVARFLERLPPAGLDTARLVLLGALVLLCVGWVLRRHPRAERGHWVLLEALLLALLIGPGVGWLVGGVGLSISQHSAVADPPRWLPYLLSVGAGLWEELVFRLGLLGGTAFLLSRLTPWREASVLTVAVILSALAFALYHHVGSGGEPLTADRFAFRAIAGILIGVVFAWRGLAVVVYMHVFYDLLCDLRLALT